MRIRIVLGALALALCTIAVASEPVVYRVEKVRRAELAEFTPDADRFVRGQKMPASRVEGGRVLEASPRGYVRIETTEGPVWVDKLDVQIHPRLPVKAECLAMVSAPVDTTAGIVRGAGEGCQ